MEAPVGEMVCCGSVSYRGSRLSVFSFGMYNYTNIINVNFCMDESMDVCYSFILKTTERIWIKCGTQIVYDEKYENLLGETAQRN